MNDYLEVFKNDDTNAFGRPFVRIKLNNSEKYHISKCMVSCGKVLKTYLNPQFPIDVYLLANETKKLNYKDDLYISLFDEYGRKHTFKKTVPVKAFDEAVPSGESTVTDEFTSDGIENIVEIENDSLIPLADIIIEFNVSPDRLSQLEDDIQLENQLAGMTTAIQDVDVRLSALGLAVNVNSLSIEGLDTRLSALGSTVSENFLIHEGEVEEINIKLSALGSTVQEDISALDSKIDNHINDKTNPHAVTKAQVGLGNCDNTSDLNKPISTATQTALDNLSGEITGVQTNLSTHIADKTNPHAVTKTQVGLSNVDNTSDLNKPISTATQSALNNLSGEITGVQTNLTNHINDKTNPHAVTKAQVGLGNVDNTSDLNKPISTATQTALNNLSGGIAGVQTNLTNHINDKTNPHAVTKAQVGLGNVDNTSDLNKPISTATQSALDNLDDRIDTNSGLITEINVTLSALGTSVDGILNTLDGLETVLHTINSGNN